MSGQRVGYIRVSSFDQNECRQLEGVELDRLFTDKLSAKTRNRPQLEELLRFVRDGDIVIVHSMDRLARNVGFSQQRELDSHTILDKVLINLSITPTKFIKT